MLVESGSTTILNTPQNICQTSPCVCSTYSAQHDTIHLIHQCLQRNTIRGQCLGSGSFPHHTLPEWSSARPALLFPFCKYWANIHFPSAALNTSVYYYSVRAPLTGPREVLLSPRWDFHFSSRVMGEGGCHKRREGILLSCALLAGRLLLLSFICCFQLLQGLGSFLSWKTPFLHLLQLQLWCLGCTFADSLGKHITGWKCPNRGRKINLLLLCSLIFLWICGFWSQFLPYNKMQMLTESFPRSGAGGASPSATWILQRFNRGAMSPPCLQCWGPPGCRYTRTVVEHWLRLVLL